MKKAKLYVRIITEVEKYDLKVFTVSKIKRKENKLIVKIHNANTSILDNNPNHRISGITLVDSDDNTYSNFDSFIITNEYVKGTSPAVYEKRIKVVYPIQE